MDGSRHIWVIRAQPESVDRPWRKFAKGLRSEPKENPRNLYIRYIYIYDIYITYTIGSLFDEFMTIQSPSKVLKTSDSFGISEFEKGNSVTIIMSSCVFNIP